MQIAHVPMSMKMLGTVAKIWILRVMYAKKKIKRSITHKFDQLA